MASHHNPDLIQRAMISGIDSHLRAALKARFEAEAKAVIDEAVNEAMKTFETAINQYRDYQRMGDTVEVILRDHRSKA